MRLLQARRFLNYVVSDRIKGEMGIEPTISLLQAKRLNQSTTPLYLLEVSGIEPDRLGLSAPIKKERVDSFGIMSTLFSLIYSAYSRCTIILHSNQLSKFNSYYRTDLIFPQVVVILSRGLIGIA